VVGNVLDHDGERKYHNAHNPVNPLGSLISIAMNLFSSRDGEQQYESHQHLVTPPPPGWGGHTASPVYYMTLRLGITWLRLSRRLEDI